MLFMLMAMDDSPDGKRKIELLYEQYHKLMYTIAYSRVENHHDAEDIELQAWEKIIRNLDKFNEVSCNETKNLIVIIVERAVLDFRRKNYRIRNTELPYGQYQESSFLAATDENMEAVEICEAMRKIPKIYRDVLVLHYVNNLSISDIAAVLDISEGLVAQRLYRGRNRLKEMKFYGLHRK